MSSNAAITLSRDKILQLLATVGKNIPKEQPEIAAADYNWKEPHFFTDEQVEKLGEFAKSAGNAVAARFTRFFQNDFQVQASSIKQYYAGYYVNNTIEQNQKGYYLILKNSQNAPSGLVTVPAVTANKWLTTLLGDSGNRDDAQTELSNLETSLLTDIVRSFAEAALTGGEKLNLRSDGNVTSNNFSLDIGDCDELLEITFDISKKDSEDKSQACLVVPCKMLMAISGKTDTTKASAPKDTQNVILEHLKEIPVTITAQLATTELTFEQIFTLQADDILLLDKKINEPITLIIEGQERFFGRLAKSKGKLAAAIAAACPTNNPVKNS